ncbi:MAG: FAD-binding oxidoreductase [Alkalispirochaeta sp.]
MSLVPGNETGGREEPRHAAAATETGRASWRRATVLTCTPESSDVVALSIRPERWIAHRAGQYYDIRMPAERVVRAFSVVSSPTVTDHLEFGIQVLPQGLLSPRLAGVRPGAKLEIRGPVGSIITWSPEMAGRLVLIGAGAGITPLLSMYEHATVAGVTPSPTLIVSAKSTQRIFRFDRYRSVLTTRLSSQDGRIDRAFLDSILGPVLYDDVPPQLRLCGPLGFIGDIVDHLLALGFPEGTIRSEAFV